MFGGGPSAPQPAPAPPAQADPAVEAARQKELEAAMKARGRAATILTGGQGDTSAAPVERKTLLGQ